MFELLHFFEERHYMRLVLVIAALVQTCVIIALKMLPANDPTMMDVRYTASNMLGVGVIALIAAAMALAAMHGDEKVFVATLFAWLIMGALRIYDALATIESKAWLQGVYGWAAILIVSYIVHKLKRPKPDAANAPTIAHHPR